MGVNHNSYNEETINKIIDELYWKNHKKDFSYFINHKKALLLCTIMAIFLLIIVISIIDNFIRHITRNNLKINNIEFNFKDIFKTSNYVNSGTDFNNQLQNTYNNMVQCAREGCRKIENPENYLLYRFGQVIFTKNGNKVDYKTVTKGLNQVFFSEPLTVESSNLKINFLNKFNDFFHKWKELQKVTDNRLYEIPELGVLLSVLFSKMSLDNFIWNANIVIDLSNKFENINNKSYREAFLEIANKIYHEKGNDNELSKKLEIELNSFNNKFTTKINLFNGKLRTKIIESLPLLIFIYVMLAIFYVSTLSFGKTIIAGVCCYIFYKFKDKIIDPAFEYKKLSNLITKAEQEANERKRQEQEKARQEAAESYESSSNYRKSAIKKEYDEDDYQDNNDSEAIYSKSEEDHINVQTQKQKTPEIKYYCKMCGNSFRDLRTLLSNTCFKSPTKKHIPFEGQNSNIYYCKCCGQEAKELRTLVSNTCFKSPTKKHIPYEGSITGKFTCMHCGQAFKDLRTLTSNTCFKSPSKKHEPYEGKQ